MPKEKNLDRIEVPVEAPNAKVDMSRVQVFDKNGKFVREYTKLVHGDKIDDYGKEFAKKIGGSYQYPVIV